MSAWIPKRKEGSKNSWDSENQEKTFKRSFRKKLQRDFKRSLNSLKRKEIRKGFQTGTQKRFLRKFKG